MCTSLQKSQNVRPCACCKQGKGRRGPSLGSETCASVPGYIFFPRLKLAQASLGIYIPVHAAWRDWLCCLFVLCVLSLCFTVCAVRTPCPFALWVGHRTWPHTHCRTAGRRRTILMSCLYDAVALGLRCVWVPVCAGVSTGQSRRPSLASLVPHPHTGKLTRAP